MQRDPRYSEPNNESWQFVKYRHMRRLGENRSVTKQSFSELIGLDPLTTHRSQAPLL